jgi:crotonobetainyl-CoA:carnitine CoA-transferase CaiB-like acyl-CoA transferase
MSGAALAALSVLDASESVAGQYCSRLMADFGADVTLVEPPGGSALRHRGPFDPALGSVAFFHLNLGKASVTLDLATAAGLEEFRRRAAAADVVLLGPGMDRARIREVNPRAVIGTISGFGEDGPYRDWKGGEMIFQALSGMMNNNGLSGQKPLFGCGDRASYAAGVGAYISVMAALVAREQLGVGQDFSHDVAENTSAMAYPFAVQYFYNGSSEVRGGRHVPLGKATCRGDWVCYWIQWHRWEAACKVLKAPHLMEDPRFKVLKDRLANWPALVREIQEIVRDRDADELVAAWQAERMNASRAYRLSELHRQMPHLAERGFWETIDTPDGERLILGPAFRLSETPRRVAGPPPALARDQKMAAAQ